VDFSGARRKVSFSLLPDVNVGDWVVVHVGFAIAKLDQEEARETLSLFEELKEYG
jgi:hydrogenase expression/formation protein HypC